jgi:DNA-binding GntR family transcriptional regulator
VGVGRSTPTVSVHSRYQDIAGQIRQRITAGEWASGDKLPRLDDLASEYNANRNTIGRAIEVLEAEGYVRAVQGRGITVERVTPDVRSPGGVSSAPPDDQSARIAALESRVEELESAVAEQRQFSVEFGAVFAQLLDVLGGSKNVKERQGVRPGADREAADGVA